MTIKQNIKSIGMVCCMAAAMTSCNDFLDIMPLNDVVLENYWTEKADVESVANSAYAQLMNEDVVTRMILWGEARADNIVGINASNTEYKQLLKGNLLPTSSFTNWGGFYTCINYCNTVLEFAPSVKEKDPNFTDSDYRQVVAEMTAVRALCYFYLVRTFRDVPYITKASIDDNQQYVCPTTDMNTIINSLINDLEKVKDDAVLSFVNKKDNAGRITRNGIYALLADLYLWRASDAKVIAENPEQATSDYEKCSEYCSKIIAYKQSTYQQEKAEGSSSGSHSGLGSGTLKLFNEQYPLYAEQTGGSLKMGDAYNAIFFSYNNFETVFGLAFSSMTAENKAVENVYGKIDVLNYKMAQVGVNTDIYDGMPKSATSVFTCTRDCRAIENIIESGKREYYPLKFVSGACSWEWSKLDEQGRSYLAYNYSPWFIYRLTDVMLMKAEAEAELAQARGDEHYNAALSLVQATYNRACNITSNADANALKSENYETPAKLRSLVLLERDRELMFEGKRWFDLVRMARREGHNRNLTKIVVKKYKENQSAIEMKLTTADALYWPYNKNELKVNTAIEQNPAYVTSLDENISLN